MKNLSHFISSDGSFISTFARLRNLSFWFRYIFEQQVILVDRLAFGPFEYAQQKIHFRFVSNSNHLFLVNLLRQPCVEPEEGNCR